MATRCYSVKRRKLQDESCLRKCELCSQQRLVFDPLGVMGAFR